MLRYPEDSRGQLVVSSVCTGHPTTLHPVPKHWGCHEEYTEWLQVGTCQLCALDTRGEHRMSREDGADYKDITHSVESVGVDMLLVPGPDGCMYPVRREDV
ncbi:hypothetical protein NP493_673g01043 [Ridgeia piscesae]|uniref:Uncharacterized protein n=1 Tax=Ridgeia piscesae TaxID=27915 RepID=A0AAD9NMZ3_RIDPI|nr:hypothetical protein NP493_673g01043 [Ridgeia piscesae]